MRLLIIISLFAYFSATLGFWYYVYTKDEKGRKVGFSLFGLGFLNIWFYAHIIFSILAFAFIVVSASVAIIYIITERNLKKKKLKSFFVSKFSSSLNTLQEPFKT